VIVPGIEPDKMMEGWVFSYADTQRHRIGTNHQQILATAGIGRATRRPSPPALMLSLLVAISLAACTGSPDTLALQPSFEVATPAGLASVSIRETPSSMTDREFLRLIEAGMEQAAPGCVSTQLVNPPYPRLRIVWHVEPEQPGATEEIAVNVFNGSVPFAIEQETLTHNASAPMLTDTIRSMSGRLLADIATRADPGAPEARAACDRSAAPQQNH
jgi:hypothetical protein